MRPFFTSGGGAQQWELGLRLNWSAGFGRDNSNSRVQVQSTVVGGRDTDSMSSMPHSESPDKRYHLGFYVQAYNVMNHTNLVNFVGVQTSPFFGHATAALPPRRIEIGTRFSF